MEHVGPFFSLTVPSPLSRYGVYEHRTWRPFGQFQDFTYFPDVVTVYWPEIFESQLFEYDAVYHGVFQRIFHVLHPGDYALSYQRNT